MISIKKVKSSETMDELYNHNRTVPEVPYGTSVSEVLISLPRKTTGAEATYSEICSARIASIETRTGRKIRRDAVRGLDVLLTYPKEWSISPEEWKKRSVNWLKKTFNIAGYGMRNVIHVVYHDDTAKHIHAFIIPVDRRGCLCAPFFLNALESPFTMRQSYISAVSKPLCNNSYYARESKAIFRVPIEESLPNSHKGESAAARRNRLLIVNASAAPGVIELSYDVHCTLCANMYKPSTNSIINAKIMALNKKQSWILKQLAWMQHINPDFNWTQAPALFHDLRENLIEYWHDRISLQQEIGYYYD